MKKSISITLGLLVILFAGSCKKDDAPSIPVYTVPTTYSYTNPNDSINVSKLLVMADQIGGIINAGNTPNTSVNASQLKAMFNGTGQFMDTGIYAGNNKLTGSGLSLAAICPTAMATDINRYFDSIALYSQGGAASHGVAGTALSLGSKKYLFSGSGIFYSQLFKKTMNGFCSYQIANLYMADSINSTTDSAKLGHYWDRAFSWFAVPVNFPTALKPNKYLGAYCTQVSPGMNSNASIMNAFLKGRAAINNKDFVTVKAQANLLIATLDTLNAACIVQEMKETNGFINVTPDKVDTVAAMGTMGEALGFVRNFQYNTGSRVITDAQITALKKLLDTTTPENPDLYNFINVLHGQYTNALPTNTAAINALIQGAYKFTNAQMTLL